MQPEIFTLSSPTSRKNFSSENLRCIDSAIGSDFAFARAQKRLNQGLSVCIFPEGGVPEDESILLDSFKDGAFRLAIEHQIPIAPMAFHDNKKRFSYTFLSGGPGKMRVKVLQSISTAQLGLEDKRTLNVQVRTAILQELENPSV